MTNKADLQRQWRIWGNGLIRATYMGLASVSVATVLALFNAISIKTAAVSVGFAVVAGLWGYLQQSPIPDVFVVEDAASPTGLTALTVHEGQLSTAPVVPVATTVVEQVAPLTLVDHGADMSQAQQDAQQVEHKKEHGSVSLALLCTLVAIIVFALVVLALLDPWIAVTIAIAAILVAILLGPGKQVG
jgi:hypothetical protein